MKNSMNVKASQKGFTLIELVVVIVILGILAVTAAPKFIDLTGDAKSSVVQAVKGSLNSAADMAHAKALIEGTVDGDLSIAGQNITFKFSYPDAASIDLLMDIDTSSSDADFDLVETGPVTYSYKGVTDPTKCQAVYNIATDKNVKPVITSNTYDC
ncbi:prepilin-type N-terminal cleavage/methylation domain-containing protein [Colwellia demingiae]|uniref:Prepilin-type N-terminal cleavage/methylation domain-containing protein n=1 Tax=Colwellia demingiae TaxID=89401 RepID=A0A5C6QPU5_9GAMM|nr:prepilin-type N-terminal cleavage/methylation domain-containing protein [Colwellia demingiae]TWX70680.1 prepilin-type N-terminal cleavage/methylation domain-containing protein [Colwellia demingiae]